MKALELLEKFWLIKSMVLVNFRVKNTLMAISKIERTSMMSRENRVRFLLKMKNSRMAPARKEPAILGNRNFSGRILEEAMRNRR